VFPFAIMFLMGGTLQLNLGKAAGFNFIGFTFTGVLGMTLFQSTMQGITSLVTDRRSDFAQEMFVAPISRYSIVIGKILGETLVAMAQVVPMIIFALILQVPLTPAQMLMLVPVCLLCCFLGGAFGVLLLGLVKDEAGTGQLFGFVILPQYFLAGIFNPITILPWYLAVFSLISPLRYIVDLVRDVVYAGRPEYHKVVLLDPITNLLAMGAMFTIFIVVGTGVFVRRETNR
jgi:ABC-2 type transport system permease protein